MNISSMTGFVRQDGVFEQNGCRVNFCFEIKSVNAKGLEIKTKLPQGFDAIEQEIKTKIGQFFSRGTFNLILTVKNESGGTDVCINTDFLNLLKNKAVEIYLENTDVFAKPSPAELLKTSGVIETADEPLDEQTKALLFAEILKTLDEALKKLQKDRLSEGQKIGEALLMILDEIDLKREEAVKIADNTSDELRGKILAQIKNYTTDIEISKERLEQEVLFYVMRADVKEELDRLKAHIAAAREIFEKGGNIGRKLDFLCQELNREANTLCSKSMNLDLTKIGMELKALIEQFREQTQNME